MKAQHTPKPWMARDDEGTGTLPCVLAEQALAIGGYFYIAQCNLYADARLFAAAPDLLTALEALLWQHDNYGQLCGMALQDARAAIKAARGEDV
jgi:hypothetical protein